MYYQYNKPHHQNYIIIIIKYHLNQNNATIDKFTADKDASKALKFYNDDFDDQMTHTLRVKCIFIL